MANKQLDADVLINDIKIEQCDLASLDYKVYMIIESLKNINTTKDLVDKDIRSKIEEVEEDCRRLERSFNYLKKAMDYVYDDYYDKKESIDQRLNLAKSLSETNDTNFIKTELEVINIAEKWYAPNEKCNLIF